MAPGSASEPLRVAVVGSGPAGFYAAQALFRADDLVSTVDMFDSLATPFGLVRHGVAPDHQKIKSVIAVYHKLASRAEFRFFGNVEFGKDIRLSDLERHYHQIVFATGAQTDRQLGVPGEELQGSHPATEFVAWYNGHPDYSHLEFDLDCEKVAVVGVGNVAVDVARILCRTAEELAVTDIADHALEALRKSRVREVHLLGRRGPAQAAFTNPEVKELGELSDTDAITLPEEVELDEMSQAALAGDRTGRRKVEILRGYAAPRQSGKSRRLMIRFCVSPVELLGDAAQRVRAVRLVRNELYDAGEGQVRSRPTERFETLEAGLVFRSVGYRGVPLADLPFRDDWGVIPNERGRVTDSAGSSLKGLYVAGWIKRGATGVIGTNKADAAETVACMIEDLAGGAPLAPDHPDPAAIVAALRERGVEFVTYEDWLKIDEREVALGAPQGRPRVKFSRREELLRVLER